MWLICFQPHGSERMTPQLICSSEQEAKQMVQQMPFSVVGTYFYMFVPLASPNGVFKRNEQYEFPPYQQPYPYYVEDKPHKQWQLEIGDWPFSQPPMCLT